MLFTCFLLAGFIFLFSPQRFTNKFQLAFARIFRWPLSISRSLMLSASTSQPLKRENNHKQAQAQNHIANLQAQLESQIAENERLRQFRKEHPLLNAVFVYGDIMQASPTELTINCGGSEGLVEGQFVIGDNSIIGTISQLSAHDAKIRLITSPLSRLAVKIADMDAVIQGSTDGTIKAPLLSRKLYSIKTGQQVFCRPKNALLTTPILIGCVSHCKTDAANPLLWDVTISPACDIKSLTSVDVIVLNKNLSEQ
jgi:cell shape-determining protein MreC